MIKAVFINKKTFIICLLQLFLFSVPGFTQPVSAPDTSDLSNMSLEDLMKYKSRGNPSELEAKINEALQVATLTPLVARRSPSIVTLISEEEIHRSGARDLIDILRMVPGIDFGLDVQGDVGIAIRGNWANEAKVLMRIDGMEMNEIIYGTLQFANRYPINQIKRIEIIRGPGSVVYGGAAEYAVINIITKSASDLNGVQVSATYGRMEHALAENNYSLAIGKKLKDFNFTLSNFIGQSNRSDQPYTDIHGNSYDMATNSQITPMNFNLGLNYKALSIHAFYDNMTLKTRDGNVEILERPFSQYFRTRIVTAEYSLKLSDKFSLIPKASFRRTSPWEVSTESTDSTEISGESDDTFGERYLFKLISVGEISKNISITSGVESFYDIGMKGEGEVFRKSEKSKVSFHNSALFAQSIIKNRLANLSLGARYEYNNSYGSAFVPRLGITKRVGKLNFKLLYSSAFKAPAIENVEACLSGDMKPEKTYIWEFESSWQINSGMYVTLNLFDITSKNTIVYVVESDINGETDGFINRDKTGSQGMEMEYKIMEKWGNINLGYSFFTNLNKPLIPEYTYEHNDHDVLAFAGHKITLNSSFNLTKNVFVSPSFLFYSGKDGINGIDSTGEFVKHEYPRTVYANIFLGDNNFLIKGLLAGIGIYDIFNQKTLYIQAFNGGHAPLPGVSREVFVRLTYNFQFKRTKK